MSAAGSRWPRWSHSGANVLILDEPTNHLDLESREALEEALQAFPGTLLLITHDRALLDAVGTLTIAVEDRTLHSYIGGWAEYVRIREERAEAERDRQAREAGRSPRRPPEPDAARRRTSAAGPSASRRDRGRRGRRCASSSRSSPTPALERSPLGRQVDPAPRAGQARPGGALRRVGGRRRLSGGGRFGHPEPFCLSAEADANLCAASLRVRRVNRAAVRLGSLANDCETRRRAGQTTGIVGAVEALEDVRKVGGAEVRDLGRGP